MVNLIKIKAHVLANMEKLERFTYAENRHNLVCFGQYGVKGSLNFDTNVY